MHAKCQRELALFRKNERYEITRTGKSNLRRDLDDKVSLVLKMGFCIEFSFVGELLEHEFREERCGAPYVYAFDCDGTDPETAIGWL
jgi:hypothetical protein